MKARKAVFVLFAMLLLVNGCETPQQKINAERLRESSAHDSQPDSEWTMVLRDTRELKRVTDELKDSKAVDVSGDQRMRVLDVARAAVKRRLKSPYSAVFSEEHVRRTADGHYAIIGSVDSQNSFGAMLRSSFVVEVDGTLNITYLHL